MKAPNPIRVLVVDDSALVRLAYTRLLQAEGDIVVVGTAENGRQALEMVRQLQPDVVVTDLVMPDMDGLAFVRQQMRTAPLPILVSSVLSESHARVLEALEAGALDFVHKPTSGRLSEMGAEMRAKVRMAARISPEALRHLAQVTRSTPAVQEAAPPPRPQVHLITIAASTGGPQALRTILGRLPAHFTVPLAIVQHIPQGFTRLLAERLNALSPLEVVEAAEGLPLKPGRAVIARAGAHLKFHRRNHQVVCHLDDEPADTLHRPSADVLFASAAQVFGRHVLAVVLTGMGQDGLAGAAEIKARGGRVIAESSATAVVFGMPRAVQEAGLADIVSPLDKIPRIIVKYIR